MNISGFGCDETKFFRCRHSSGCILKKDLCNEELNCPDGSDEDNCNNSTGEIYCNIVIQVKYLQLGLFIKVFLPSVRMYCTTFVVRAQQTSC